jgi:acetyl esterase/lipase
MAETRAFNRALEELIRTLTPVYRVPPDVTRRARVEGRSVLPAPVYVDTARAGMAPGRAGEIPIRVFDAPEPRGAYLHFHGGGWVLGGADQQDPLLAEIAERAGRPSSASSIASRPSIRIPPGRTTARTQPSGSSSSRTAACDRGGVGRRAARGRDAAAAPRQARNLAAPLRRCEPRLRRLRPNGTPSRLLWGDRELVLSGPSMDWFADCFLPGLSFEQRRDPDISPLYADLRDLPPALFTCGTLDPLQDDSLFMDARWRAAGNESRLSLYDEAVHGFTAFPLEVGRRSRAEQLALLRG